MKLKNYWKRFWTLDRHHAEGFTLVELIVVIAILAILAGVAIPVYSGYIKKAEMANDQQLIDTINTAFAAACLDSGVDRFALSAVTAQIKLNANNAVDMASIKPEKVKESFAAYYEGNTNAQFKVVSEIIYVKSLGMFATTDQAGNVTITYAGATLNIPQEYIDLVNVSTFIQADSLGGTDGLLDKIANVTDFASKIIGTGGNAANLLTGVTTSPEFRAFAAEALGIDPTDNAAFIAKNAELIAEMRKDPQYANKSDTELSNIYLTNAAVLYAANNATQMSQEEIMASLTNPDVKTNIITNMQNGNTTTAFSQATLAYGMYTAWAHHSGNTTAQGLGEVDVMNDLNNPEFQAYLSTPQAQTDLEAYLAALSIVNSNTQDPDAVSNLVVNGFGDSELKDAVGSLFE